jgi:hypothetical protein
VSSTWSDGRNAKAAVMAGCSKRPFVSEEVAEDSRWAMLRRPRTGKLPCRSYHCARCGFWHWTSLPRP